MTEVTQLDEHSRKLLMVLRSIAQRKTPWQPSMT